MCSGKHLHMLRVNWPTFELITWKSVRIIQMKTYVNQVWYCQTNGSQIIELSDDNYLLLSKVDKILTLDPLTSKSIGSSNYFDVSVHQFLILVNCLSNKGFLRYWSNSTYSQLTDQLSNQRTDAIQHASFFTKRGEKQHI